MRVRYTLEAKFREFILVRNAHYVLSRLRTSRNVNTWAAQGSHGAPCVRFSMPDELVAPLSRAAPPPEERNERLFPAPLPNHDLIGRLVDRGQDIRVHFARIEGACPLLRCILGKLRYVVIWYLEIAQPDS